MRAVPIIIGIDQGTTNTKALALDAGGGILSEASRPIAISAPEPGAVEQNADAMVANAVACVRDVLAGIDVTAADVAGIGIANQTETLVIWDRRTGRPAMNAMGWQCRRGAAEIAHLDEARVTALIRSRTGLDLDPTFTAAKLKWIFCHRPEISRGLRSGDFLFGTVDTWLVWKLTGGAVWATEPGNASRTMLFDIDRIDWDPELLDLFDLDLPRRPECRRSCANFGETDPSFFGAPIPITALMGDQQASLFGHGCFDAMQMKVTYGTGAFLWINAGSRPHRPPQGIIRTIAWQIDRPCYAFEGFVMHAGRILDWLAHRLQLKGGGAGVAAEAEKAGESAGVILVPAFQGLASPWWQPGVRGALLGLSEGTTSGHIAHAGLEAVCFQIRTVLETVEWRGEGQAAAIKVDGGLTRSSYFTQLQANVLGVALAPTASGSVTAYGAALMAGLRAGLWQSLDELCDVVPRGESLVPDHALAGSLDQSYRAWRTAVDMLISQYGEATTGMTAARPA